MEVAAPEEEKIVEMPQARISFKKESDDFEIIIQSENDNENEKKNSLPEAM